MTDLCTCINPLVKCDNTGCHCVKCGGVDRFTMKDDRIEIIGETFESVKVMRLSPGDVIVVKADQYLSTDQVEYIREMIKARFPHNETLILGKGLDVSIVTPEGAR